MPIMNNQGDLLSANGVMGALAHLAEELSAAPPADEALNVIVNTSLSACRADKATVLLFDPWKKESLKTIVRSGGVPEGGIEHAVNDIVAGWLLKHRMPLLADDFVEAIGISGLPDSFRKYGSVLAIPVVYAGEVLGMINLMNEAGGSRFDRATLNALTVIAHQSAQYIHNAKLQERLFEENQRLRGHLQQEFSIHGIVGTSEPMKRVFDTVLRVAKSNATVLITGETGTGKELVVRAIHVNSDRVDRPFVALNCAAIPDSLVESELFGHERGAFTGAMAGAVGKFELANGGTIFLDEISEMPLDIQPKLLRVLETRKFYRVGSSKETSVDVRVMAASSKDLTSAMAEGLFREDLYYRLNVFPIQIPPLRQRKEDIPAIAQHWLEEFSGNRVRLSPGAIEILSQQEWRGNVRELKNFMERISIQFTAGEISVDMLRLVGVGGTEAVSAPISLRTALASLLQQGGVQGDRVEEMEKILVETAIQVSPNNASEAARLLGIDRMAFERRRKKYGL
jgi:transcriptional regulator with GAF, ATPase, and Fis domain